MHAGHKDLQLLDQLKQCQMWSDCSKQSFDHRIVSQVQCQTQVDHVRGYISQMSPGDVAQMARAGLFCSAEHSQKRISGARQGAYVLPARAILIEAACSEEQKAETSVAQFSCRHLMFCRKLLKHTGNGVLRASNGQGPGCADKVRINHVFMCHNISCLRDRGEQK